MILKILANQSDYESVGDILTNEIRIIHPGKYAEKGEKKGDS